MRGVNAIERLGLKSGEDACETTPAEKAQQILKYARKAQSEISAMAEKVRINPLPTFGIDLGVKSRCSG